MAALRALISQLAAEIAVLDAVIAGLLAGHDGYHALQALPGIGPVLAAVIVAEIGGIRRFSCPGRLCCWAGLTPRHREPDATVARGHITQQGAPILRWAVAGAIRHQPATSPVRGVQGPHHRRPRHRSAQHRQDRGGPPPAHRGVRHDADGQARSLAAHTAAQHAA